MIRFNNGAEFETGQIMGMPYDMLGYRRSALSIKIKGSDFASVTKEFITGAQFSVVDSHEEIRYTETTKDLIVSPATEDSEAVIEQIVTQVPYTVQVADIFEKYDFVLVGDIVVHPDGLITVIMGKKTDEELKTEALELAVDSLILKQLEG